MSKHKRLSIAPILVTLLFANFSASVASASRTPEKWGDYLDYAYIYSSADPEDLGKRLAEYSREAGISLDDYIANFLSDPLTPNAPADATVLRRSAVAYLLQYLAARDPSLIDRAAEMASLLGRESDSYESRYWRHYIEAHRALELGNASGFVSANLDLWLDVVVPLEAPFDTLEALSLSQSPTTGFVSALPYVFENITRMILIRSQEMGLASHLDPLASLVRLLHHNRVGMNPEVIPEAASSRGYLERIVARLDGPESDAGGLTFTLLLFEAGKFHDQSRALLASQGFSEESLKAIDVTSGAYQRTWGAAKTAQGRAAVYSRVLRLLGETNAAKQRLSQDPYIESPFSIEGAIATYDELHRARGGNDWETVGFARVGRQAYLQTMRGLWEEIQEASLNTADYYLARSLAATENSDEYVRSAAETYTRYLSFFDRYLGDEESDVVPDSAYFAAYEAAKGYGDAFLNFASRTATASELEVVAQRYLEAMRAFPFDPHLWPSLATSLERLGRSGEYLGHSRPIADAVARSRHIDSWIKNRKTESDTIQTLRSALSDDLVLMYLGFAQASGNEELDASLESLRSKRDDVAQKLAWLEGKARPHDGARVHMPPAAPGSAAEVRSAPINMTREIARTKMLLEKLRRKVDARSKALPLYRAALKTDRLIEELRSQRDHAVHTLLRRIYHERRS
ncbi:MAG: hypothetical protein JRG89_03210 [Deltaproteobacteria bacterium]|nr:hypothetical protein [Deltaproteobacteria bacterium]